MACLLLRLQAILLHWSMDLGLLGKDPLWPHLMSKDPVTDSELLRNLGSGLQYLCVCIYMCVYMFVCVHVWCMLTHGCDCVCMCDVCAHVGTRGRIGSSLVSLYFTWLKTFLLHLFVVCV